MMRILDTNICIYIIKRRPASVFERLRTHSPGSVAISSITLSELSFGANKSIQREKNLNALQAFLCPLMVLDYDCEAAEFYGALRAHLEKSGTPIGALDTLIAAHALATKSILVTNNEKEFTRVPGLIVENWV